MTGLPAAAADSADLEVSISTVWGVPNFHSSYPGGAYTFQAAARNLGPNTATNVTLTIPVSRFLQATVVDYSGTTCTSLPLVDGNGSIVCTAPSLEPNHYMAVEVTAGVAPSTAGGTQIRLSASADSDTADPTPTNDSASDVSTVWGAITPSTDLTGPGESSLVALPGHDVTWTVSAYNAGYEPAVHPAISISIPSGLTLVSATPTSSWRNSGCGTTGTALVCTTPVLLYGTGASFELVLHVGAGVPIGSTLTPTAVASSDTVDEDATNNSGSLSLYVGGADIAVAGSGPRTAPAGRNASYTLTISNDGPEAAVNPQLDLWAPWGTSFVSIDQTSGPTFSCDVNNVEGSTRINCGATRLAVDASAQFTFVVAIDPDLEPEEGGGDPTIWVSPQGRSESPDPDDENNTTTIVTVVSVLAVPVIDSFTPRFAAVGTVVTITGSGLSGATDVIFNTTHATTFRLDDELQLHATVPKGTTSGRITVTTAAGSDTSGAALMILTAKPAVTSFAPQQGVPGESVTITGGNLFGISGVTIGGAAATFEFTSNTTISATVPTGASTGKIAVTNAVGTATSSTRFIVVHAPSIASFSPASAAPGSRVTLTGDGFHGVETVTLNGVAAKFKVVSDTILTFTVPNAASSGAVTVTNDAGSATSAGSFSVVAPLKVTGYTPRHGPANALRTTVVTITGSGFTGTTSVRVGTLEAASFTVVSDTRITATAAVGTASGKVVVRNGGATADGPGIFIVDR